MPKELSFKINNTVVDSRNKIKKFYNASINRKTFLTNYYAKALFYNPAIVNQITNHIAAEIGYQKAIRELVSDILLLA